MLESKSHDESSFVTLTYDESQLPADDSVSKRAVQLFLKRLRKRIGALRYFAVGEYGDNTNRPHYHLACFGTADAMAIDDAWRQGFTYTGELTEKSAAYIAGYCTKKMTNADDPRLEGRAPEFALMSRRPGIGALSTENLAAAYNSRGGASALARAGDVVDSYRCDGVWPIGRYLKGRLREAVGMDQSVVERVLHDASRARREVLLEPGAVKALEEKRIQTARRVAVRDSITRSRKGVGL